MCGWASAAFRVPGAKPRRRCGGRPGFFFLADDAVAASHPTESLDHVDRKTEP